MSEEPTSIWVTSDLAADQQFYVATVHFNDDLSHSMTTEEAVAYAGVVLRAAGAAAYDAAVLAQLTKKLQMPTPKAAQLLIALRDKRGQQSGQLARWS